MNIRRESATQTKPARTISRATICRHRFRIASHRIHHLQSENRGKGKKKKHLSIWLIDVLAMKADESQ